MQNLGISLEYFQNRISFFDTETLTLLKQINVSMNPIDVAITPDGNKAIVTLYDRNLNNSQILQINIQSLPPTVINIASYNGAMGEVVVTPDGKYAVIIDSEINGTSNSNRIYSYDIVNNLIVNTMLTSAQSIAISPNGNGLILASEFKHNTVRSFNISNNGFIADSGIEISVGSMPADVLFTPDGNFAFISNYNSNYISVLNTSNINTINEVVQISSSSIPQTMTISKDGKKLFLLTESNVDIFNVIKSFPYLIQDTTFQHQLAIMTIAGVDQIAVNYNEDKIFIVGSSKLSVFKLDRTLIGEVAGIEARDGIDIVKTAQKTKISRGVNIFNLLEFNENDF